MDGMEWPNFDDLPLCKDGPPGNAWGLFGPDDQLGMLNLLTPQTVTAAAASEIRTGLRVSLDWSLDKPAFPAFGRKVFQHQNIPHGGMIANDDVIHINTQSSTQWDGFRHFAYQSSGKFFGGQTQDGLEQNERLGINVWTEKGGIVGRGILLDWADWAHRNGVATRPLQTGAVKLEELRQVMDEQDVQIKPGDILFIRVGFTAAYNALSETEREAYPSRQPGGLLGLEATHDSLRWLWDSRFAAVASDCPSFERGPIMGPYNSPDVNIHQWALAGWGMPLGEMFDLEELARQCKLLGRYSFFISSVPLKIPRGVASPPNAIAIF